MTVKENENSWLKFSQKFIFLKIFIYLCFYLQFQEFLCFSWKCTKDFQEDFEEISQIFFPPII